MLFTGMIATQMSGSMGGVVASHNAGGSYFRQRVVPTDPATTGQQSVRAAVGNLAGRWVSTLTQAQRDAWTVYAANVPLIGRTGVSRNVSGLAMYIRTNTPLVAVGGTPIDDGPMTYMLTSVNGAGLQVTAPGTTTDTFFDNSDEWATTTGGRLLVYASKPQNPTINFFKGPYRYLGSIMGDTTTPPTSPASTIVYPWAVTAGMKVFAQFRGLTADGRLSTVVRSGIEVA